MGLAPTSDQRVATAFLREHLANHLGSAKFQDRAHDHVLREDERKRGVFQSACHYIRENPLRAGLCADWTAWSCTGAMIAGYPDLDPRRGDFWEKILAHPRTPSSEREQRTSESDVARRVSVGTELLKLLAGSSLRSRAGPQNPTNSSG
jgi:hypothetical protein